MERELPEHYGLMDFHAGRVFHGAHHPLYPFTGITVKLHAASPAGPKVGSALPGGVCAIVTFGDFTGGAMCLYEAGIRLDLQCGDVLILPTTALTCFDLHFSGRRGLLVLNGDSLVKEWVIGESSWQYQQYSM